MRKFIVLPQLFWPSLIGLDKKLEKLAREGKNLDTMAPQNALFLTLFPTAGREFRFAVDYNKNALPAYRSEWESRGWELCARFAGYFIWRIVEKEPAYPDQSLLISRRKKLGSSFLACAFIFLAAALVMLATTAMVAMNGHGDKVPKLMLQSAAVLLVSIYFAWSGGKMRRSVKKSLR